MDEKILTDFHQKMTDERLNGHNRHQADLIILYKEALSGMAYEYSEYRKLVPTFLFSLESNNDHSISYSILLFFELYEQLINTRQFSFFDLAITEYDADYAMIEKMKPIFEASYSKNNQQRLSEDNFDISTLSDEDRKGIAALIIRKLQSDSKQLNWNKEMVDVNLMQCIFLRQILGSLHNSELFYHVFGLLVDRLTSSEYYQAARDIAEEVLLSSYKDEIPELGYFNSFRLYSNIGSINASLLYANLSLTCILKKKPPYSEKFVKEVVWQGLKFFRNVKLFPWAVKIYNELPVELNFLDYERRSLDHTYFTVLLSMKEPLLPSKLLDYMLKEREELLAGGENEALPWLITLYNIKRLYPTANFSASGLGFFLNTFENIVPPDTVKKHKDVIEADSEDLKSYLKESLVKLNETRNAMDFIYDNESAIRISSRLIEYSSKKQDVSGYLLSMVLKSDYSILFKQKKSKELVPFILPEVNIDSLETLYDDNDALYKALPVNPNTSIQWLAFSEGKMYQLDLLNGAYSFHYLTEWKDDVYRELLQSDYFVDLKFDDIVNDKGGVRQLSPEEYAEEEKKIALKLSIGKLFIDYNAKDIYVIKDMELSRFPHNLFLNSSGDFIAKHVPVANVLSTEWLLQSSVRDPLSANYTKSIWIPTESGDYALNYLYSNIESALHAHSFEIFQQMELANPLSADINIVCSHGAKNISETQIIFQEDHATYNLSSIIGNGKILIFFVCYSGSMKTEFFRNNVTSMVKRFIAQGYQTVIAPYWALDVTIPRYWLPEFLKSLDAGLTASQATFNANMKVCEKYPTPAAWACLHFYGNPNLKIDDNSQTIAETSQTF